MNDYATLKALLDEHPDLPAVGDDPGDAEQERSDRWAAQAVLNWLVEPVPVSRAPAQDALVEWGAGGRSAKLEDAAANRLLTAEVRSQARAVAEMARGGIGYDPEKHASWIAALRAASVLAQGDVDALTQAATTTAPRWRKAWTKPPILGDVLAAMRGRGIE